MHADEPPPPPETDADPALEQRLHRLLERFWTPRPPDAGACPPTPAPPSSTEPGTCRPDASPHSPRRPVQGGPGMRPERGAPDR